MDQCLVEQRYVRGAQLRTLIYNQVGVLGVVLGPGQEVPPGAWLRP